MWEPLKITPADVHVGIKLGFIDGWSDFLDVLYVAIQGVGAMVGWIGKKVALAMPSGTAIYIWDGSNIIDFRMQKKRYAWARMRFFHQDAFSIPWRLPNIDINKEWELFWGKATELPGSELWWYHDATADDYLQGKDCTPPRKYSIFSDFIGRDALIIGLVIAIVAILHKIGFTKIGDAIIKGAFKIKNWWLQRQTRSNIKRIIEDVGDNIDAVKAGREELETVAINVASMIPVLESHSTAISELSSRVGLKFKL